MALDLHMLTGNRYSVALLVFFTTYIVFELPSNLMLRRFGAAKWLTFLAFSWGVTIIGAGFAKKWTDMVVVRILIGIFEAGFMYVPISKLLTPSSESKDKARFKV